jgi:membrane protein required for colicin V production
MTSFDYLIAIVFIISCIYGTYRGFIKEAMSILGLVLSIFFASKFSQPLAKIIPVIDNSDVIIVVAFILILISTLVISSLIGKGLNNIIKFSGLGFFNRFLGFSFGFVRGLLVIFIIVYLSQIIPLIDLIDKDKSMLIPYLDPLFSFLTQYLPKYQTTHVEYDYTMLTRELI